MAVSDQVAKAVMQAIQEQMWRHTFCDVIIMIKDRTFECHRFLLSACSKFFRDMFSTSNSRNSNKMVEITGIDPDTFSLVIDYIYKAINILSSDNITSVWHAANILKIDFLIENCENFQTNHLSRDNCIDIYLNAKLLDSKILMNKSWKLIVAGFEHLRKTQQILMLDYEDMVKLVGHDELIASSEDVVIETILRWVRFISENDVAADHDRPSIKSYDKRLKEDKIKVNQIRTPLKEDDESEDKRLMQNGAHKIVRGTYKGKVSSNCNNIKKQIIHSEQYLPSLLRAAKICLVSNICLQDLTENKMVRENVQAFAVVLEALRYQLQPGRRHDYSPPYAIYRSSSQLRNVTIAIFMEAGQVRMSCRTLDGTWFQLAAPLNSHPYSGKAVTYENDIYVTYLNVAYKYYSSTNIWRPLLNLHVAQNNHALICLGTYIYAVGGDNCTTIERLNAADEQRVMGSGRWETIGNLTQAVSNIVVTTFGSNIIVFGNTNASSTTTTMQCFDTQTMTAYNSIDDMSGSSNKMVALKQGDNTYLLQATGALWKVTACDKISINLELIGMVWDIPIDLAGAVICNQELLILATNIDLQMPRDWDTTKFSEFKHVKILERNASCFLNNVVLKTFLIMKEA